MDQDNPNWLPVTIGQLIAKVDGLGQQIADSDARTGQRIDSVKADISALSRRVDNVESDIDKFRGAGIAIKAAWLLAGATVSGVTVTLILG